VNHPDHYQRITTQRGLALAMLAIESLAIGYLSHTVAFPLVIVVFGVLAAASTIRLQMHRQRVYDVIALIAIVFVAKYMLTEDNPRYTRMFASQHIAFSIAQFVLTLQTGLFLVKRRDDRLPFMFPGMGVIALVCASIIRVEGNERYIYQAMCVTFALLAALYCDASRRFINVGPKRRFGRPAATAVTLTAVAVLAWISATAMHRYERQMDELVRHYLMNEQPRRSIGFSETSALGSVALSKQNASTDSALRIVSQTSPGYLRGRAYAIYENRKWLMMTSGRTINPGSTAPLLPGDSSHPGNCFSVVSSSSSQQVERLQLHRFEVWPTSAVNGTFMAPGNVKWLLAQSPVVTIDRHDILRGAEITEETPYTLYCAVNSPVQLQSQPDPQTLALMTANPKWVNESPELCPLADAIFKDCQTTEQKVAAVRKWFAAEFKYSLRVDVPDESSDRPLRWFLLSRSAAHCEYFASGATILLRMAGVPSRYVTGFVVHEKNRFSGEWVARGRDAHAWCEIWDSNSGWQIVDVTPSSGIPSSDEVSSSQQFREYLRNRVQRLRTEWQQHGITLIGRLASEFATSPLGMMTLLLFAGLLCWRQRQSILQVWARRWPAFEPGVEPLQKMCVLVDGVVFRRFRPRFPGETLDQFAAALSHATVHEPVFSETAKWYRQYSTICYSTPLDQTAISELSQQVDDLISSLRSVQLASRNEHRVPARQ